MVRVNSAQFEPGMVLAAPVLDQRGRRLLPAETTLTDKHLRIFKTWGIAEVQIRAGQEEEAADAGPGVADPALVARATDHAKKLFAHTDLRHPVMSELFRQCVQRLISDPSWEDNYGT